MSSFIDLTNQKYEKLTVIKRIKNDNQNKPMWLCKCSCDSGKLVKARGSALKNGNIRSCGCLKKDIILETKKKYNKARNKWHSKIGVNGKSLHLGLFENILDAIQSRKQAEEKYFGKWSYDNSTSTDGDTFAKT